VAVAVQGSCVSRFAEVGEEFERNFAVRGEVGASVCLTVDGETVVDLWGGTIDVATGRPWEADTLTMVWSCTKGATSLCAHLLADRGELDLDAPVTRYWPEFAKNGKADVPVRMLLDHQVGLPAVTCVGRVGQAHDRGRSVLSAIGWSLTRSVPACGGVGAPSVT